MPGMQQDDIAQARCIAILRFEQVSVEMDKPFEICMRHNMGKAKWEIPAGPPPKDCPAEALEPYEEQRTRAALCEVGLPHKWWLHAACLTSLSLTAANLQ